MNHLRVHNTPNNHILHFFLKKDDEYYAMVAFLSQDGLVSAWLRRLILWLNYL